MYKEYINERLNGMYSILETSNNLLLEGILKNRKKRNNEIRQKKQYKNSKVKIDIKGIKMLSKGIIKKYKFKDIYHAIDDDTFGNYEKGSDFESFNDFLIVRIVDEDDKKINDFYKELNNEVKNKYKDFDVEIEYDKTEASIYAFLL